MMNSPIWNEPKQERSRRRFAHILDTAADLFAQHGIDAVTTNHIADRADVAIGSIYQFFPSKEAVIAAVLDRYLVQMSAIFPSMLGGVQPFEAVVSGVIDGLMQFDHDHPAFGELFAASNTPPHEALNNVMQNTITHSIAEMLGIYHPAMTEEQRWRCALVGYGIVKGIVGLNGIDDEAIAVESKTVLIAYVSAFIAREDIG